MEEGDCGCMSFSESGRSGFIRFLFCAKLYDGERFVLSKQALRARRRDEIDSTGGRGVGAAHQRRQGGRLGLQRDVADAVLRFHHLARGSEGAGPVSQVA